MESEEARQVQKSFQPSSSKKELLQLLNEKAAEEMATEKVGVETAYNLPQRDSFLRVNMKINSKRHVAQEDLYFQTQRESEALLKAQDQEYNSEKLMKLKIARERFLGRKAEFAEKRRLKHCQAEVRRLSNAPQ